MDNINPRVNPTNLAPADIVPKGTPTKPANITVKNAAPPDVVPSGVVIPERIQPLGATYDVAPQFKDYLQRNAVHPTSDLREGQAQEQTVWDRVGNGLLRFLGTTLTKTGQFAGHIGGVALLPTHGMDGITSNALVELFAGMEEDIKEALPIYKTNKYLDGNVWQQMGSASFWADDVVDGFAFLASMFVPGMVAGKVLKTSSTISKALGASMRGTKYGRAAMTKNPELIANWASKIDRFNLVALSAIGEAGFEARETRNAIEQSYYNTDESGKKVAITNPETGVPYSAEEIRRISSEGAKNVFVGNLGLLMITNFIQIDALMSMLGKKTMMSTGTEMLKGATKKATTLGLMGAVGKSMGLNIISEGIVEEGFQHALQQYAVENAGKDKNVKDIVSGVVSKWWEGFNDDEAIKAMVLGGIISFIPGGVSGAVNYNKGIKQANIKSQLYANSLYKYKANELSGLFVTEEVDGVQKVKLDESGQPVLDKVKLAEMAPMLLAEMSSLKIANDEHTTPDQIKSLISNKIVPYALDLMEKGIVGKDLIQDIEYTLSGQLESLIQSYGQDSDIVKDFKEQHIDPIVEEVRRLQADFNYASNLITTYRGLDNKAPHAAEFKARARYTYAATKYNQRMQGEQLPILIEERDKHLKDKATSLIDYEVSTYYSILNKIKKLQKTIKEGSKDAAIGPVLNTEDLNSQLSTLKEQLKEQRQKVLGLKEDYNNESDKTLPVDLSYINRGNKEEAFYDKIELEMVSDLIVKLEGEIKKSNELIENIETNTQKYFDEEYNKFIKDRDNAVKTIEENSIKILKDNITKLVNEAARDDKGNVIVTKEMQNAARQLKDGKKFLADLVASVNRESKPRETKVEPEKTEDVTEETTKPTTVESEKPLTATEITKKVSEVMLVKYNQLLSILLGEKVNMTFDNLIYHNLQKDHPTWQNIIGRLDIITEGKTDEEVSALVNNLMNILSQLGTLQTIYAHYNNGERLHKNDGYVVGKLAAQLSESLKYSMLLDTGIPLRLLQHNIDLVALQSDLTLDRYNDPKILEIISSLGYVTLKDSAIVSIQDNIEVNPIFNEFITESKEEETSEVDPVDTEDTSESTTPTIPIDTKFNDNSISIYLGDLLENFPNDIRDGFIKLDPKDPKHIRIMQLFSALQNMKKGDTLQIVADTNNPLYTANKGNWETIPLAIKIDDFVIGHLQTYNYLKNEFDLINSVLNLEDNQQVDLGKLLSTYIKGNISFEAFSASLKTTKIDDKQSPIYELVFKALDQLAKYNTGTNTDQIAYRSNFVKAIKHLYNLSEKHNNSGGIRSYSEWQAKIKGELNQVETIRKLIANGQNVVVKAENLSTGVYSENLEGKLSTLKELDLTVDDVIIRKPATNDSIVAWYNSDGTLNTNKYPVAFAGSKEEKGFYVLIPTINANFDSANRVPAMPLKLISTSVTAKDLLSALKRLPELIRDIQPGTNKFQEVAKLLSIPLAEVYNDRVVIKANNVRYSIRFDHNTGNTKFSKEGENSSETLIDYKKFDEADYNTIVNTLTKGTIPIRYLIDFNADKATLSDAINTGKLKASIAVITDGDNIISYRLPTGGREGNSLDLKVKPVGKIDDVISEFKAEPKVEDKPDDKTDDKTDDQLNDYSDSDLFGDYATIGEVEEYGEDIDIESAQKWWDARFKHTPLKFDLYEHLFKNGKYAVFHNAMVYISTTADYGIHYHEAFHVAFNLYATPERQLAIYREAIKFYGTSDYKVLHEKLAEDFRKYAISRENTTVAGKILQLFKELLNYITNFLDTNKVTAEFFRDIYDGNLTAQTSPNFNNKSLLMMDKNLFEGNKAKLLPKNKKLNDVDLHEYIATVNKKYGGKYIIILRSKSILLKDGKTVERLYAEVYNTQSGKIHSENYSLIAPIFNTGEEQQSALNMLLGIYPKVRDEVLSKFGKAYKNLTKKELLTNPELNLRNRLATAITNVINAAQSTDSTKPRFHTPEQINFLNKVKNHLRDTSEDGSLFDFFRKALQDVYKAEIVTYEELLEQAEAKNILDDILDDDELSDDANPLTKSWLDEDLISEPGLDKISSTTRSILGRLLKKDFDNKPIKNRLTGLPEFIDLRLEYARLQHSLIGSVTMEDMMAKLGKASYSKPYLLELMRMIENSDYVANSLFTDFNRVVVHEETINITSNTTEGVSIADRVKRHYHKLTDIWAEEFKNKFYEGELHTEDFKKVTDNFRSNYRELVAQLKEEKASKYSPAERLTEVSKLFSTYLKSLGINVDSDIISRYINNPYDERRDTNSLFIQHMIVGSLYKSIDEIINYVIAAEGSTIKIYEKLNNLAELISDYVDFPIEFSYLGAEGNQKFAVNDKNILTEFAQLIHNDAGHDILLEKLTRYMQDPSMKYSNFMQAILQYDHATGEFVQVDGKYVLKPSFLNHFNIKVFGGIDFSRRGKQAKLGKMNDKEFAITQLILYNYSLAGKQDSALVRYTLPTVADTGKNYTITLPYFKLKGDRNITTKRFKLTNELMVNAIHNVIFSELVDMQHAKDLLFNIIDGRLELKPEVANNSYLQVGQHYIESKTEVDSLGRPLKVFIDNEGRPTGRVFKFHTVKELNKIESLFNPATGLVNFTIEDVKNDPEIKEIVKEAIEKDIYERVTKFSKRMQPFAVRTTKNDRLVIDYNKHLSILSHPDGYGHNIVSKRGKRAVDTTQQHLFAEYAINSWLANIQIGEMFLGKMSEFKSSADFVKRAKLLVQKGRSVTTNEVLRVQTFYTPKRIVSDYKTILQSLNVGVSTIIRDKDARKAMVLELAKPYKEGSVAADGMSYTTTTRLVNQMKRFGLFEERANMFRSEVINGNTHYYLRDDISIEDLKYYMNSLKTLYTARDLNSNGKLSTRYKKHSEFPLDPLFTKNIPSLEVIRKHMEDNNIDILSDNTADKSTHLDGGSISLDGETINLDALQSLPVEELSASYDRVQLDVPEMHLDKDINLGLQIRKHLLANINQRGKYRNIITGEELVGKDLEEKIHDVLSKIVTLDRFKLEQRLKLNSDKLLQKEAGAIKGIYEVLVKQFRDRNFSQDIIDAISPNMDYSDFDGSLDLLGIRKQIVQVLLSLYTKGVMRTKMPGMQLVNISNEFMSFKNLPKEAQELSRKLTTKIENGIHVVEVLIPAWSRDFENADGSLKSIDEVDDRLKTILGYRIPSSAKHSAFVMKVVGFTPKEYGSIAIVPESLMINTGWDFDIDSFFVSRYNHKVDETGKISLVEFTELSKDGKVRKQQLQNELTSMLISVLGSKYSTMERLSIAETPKTSKVKKKIDNILGSLDALDPYDAADQLEIFRAAIAGSRGLGMAANTVAVATILQKLNLSLINKIETVQDRTGDMFKLDKLLKLNGKIYDLDGNNIIQTLGENVVAFVDSMKNPLPRNLNEFTFGVYSLLQQLMLGIEFSSLFLAQDAVEINSTNKDIESTMEMLDQDADGYDYKSRVRILTNIYENLPTGKKDRELDRRINFTAEGTIYIKTSDPKEVAKYSELLGIDVTMGDDQIQSNKGIVLSHKFLEDQLKLKVKYDELTSEQKAEYWRNQLHIHAYFNYFNTVHSQILNEALLLNADKHNPKTFDELTTYLNKIKELAIENNKAVKVNGKSGSILRAVYSKDSKYRNMRSYLMNTHIAMRKKFSPLFITESPAFDKVIQEFRDRFSNLNSKELSVFSERFREYLIARVLDDHSLFNIAEEETHRILGLSKDVGDQSAAERFIDYRDQRLKSGEVKLSDEHWINFINPMLSENQLGVNFRIHKLQALPVDGTSSIHDNIKSSMIKDYIYGTIEDKAMIEELVQYEFLTSGLTYSRSGLRRLMPNKLLYELQIPQFIKESTERAADKNNIPILFGAEYMENFVTNNSFNYKLVPRINLEKLNITREDDYISISREDFNRKSRRIKRSTVFKLIEGEEENTVTKILYEVASDNPKVRKFKILDTRGSSLFFEPKQNVGIANMRATNFKRNITGGIKLITKKSGFSEEFTSYGEWSTAKRDMIQGNAADINMRMIAEGAIVESNNTSNPSYTNVKAVADKYNLDVRKTVSGNTYYSLKTNEGIYAKTILLSTTNKALRPATKRLIKDMADRGMTFLVGNSEQDLPLIIYLQEIGATYHVHGFKSDTRYMQTEVVETVDNSSNQIKKKELRLPEDDVTPQVDPPTPTEPQTKPVENIPNKTIKLSNNNLTLTTKLTKYPANNYITYFKAGEALDSFLTGLASLTENSAKYADKIRKAVSENNTDLIGLHTTHFERLNLNKYNLPISLKQVIVVPSKDGVALFAFSEDADNLSTVIDIKDVVNNDTQLGYIFSKQNNNIAVQFTSDALLEHYDTFTKIYPEDVVDTEVYHNGEISSAMRTLLDSNDYYGQMYKANQSALLAQELTYEKFMSLPDELKDDRLNCIL